MCVTFNFKKLSRTLKVIIATLPCTALTAFIIIVANVSLRLSENGTSRSDYIDCPGDTIAYICAIASNTEDLHLLWTVILPDMVPLEFMYSSEFLAIPEEYNELDINISSSLLEYAEEFIKSKLILTVLNGSMNGTVVECSIGDLGSEMVSVLVNTSGIAYIST